VAADDLTGGAGDLAGAVGVDGQRPAELVQHDMMMPPAIILQVREAGAAAIGAVDHVVRFAARCGLVAAAPGGIRNGQARDLAMPSVIWDGVVQRSVGADFPVVSRSGMGLVQCHDLRGGCRLYAWYLSQSQLSPSRWDALRRRVCGRRLRRGRPHPLRGQARLDALRGSTTLPASCCRASGRRTCGGT
jgi:hypothetical protein